jgi:molybdopterin-biosynthesis enzyme MoeA-like protein
MRIHMGTRRGSDGIQAMKRIEVIADDESEIIEAVQRMSNNYDFVVTSGGIGPTYASGCPNIQSY